MDTSPAKTTEAELAGTLAEVARLRKDIDEKTELMNAMLDAVRNSPAYRSLELDRAEFSEYLAAAEADAKELALQVYNASGVNGRYGVTVKTFTTTRLEYDYNAAYKWASESAKELIVLDQKLFEEHALAVAKTVPVPCVKIIEEAEDRAQLDKRMPELDKLGQRKGK